MTIQVSAQRTGFTPTRVYSNDACRTYPVTLSTNQPLAIGAAVAMNNGTVVPVTAGQNPASPGLGVVVGVLDSNGKPLTFSQPTRGPYLTSGATGFAIVLHDPNMTYRVRFEGSAGNDVVGNLVQVTADNSVNVSTGISQQAIKANSSADNSALFRVIGKYPDSLTGQNGTDRYVEVQWNRHMNRLGASGDQ